MKKWKQNTKEGKKIWKNDKNMKGGKKYIYKKERIMKKREKIQAKVIKMGEEQNHEGLKK